MIIIMNTVMARTPSSKKQETHDKIVRTAAAAIRKRGYDGISVAEVMSQAGLTHGGFYAHFPSRDAMLAEAYDRASAESLDGMAKVADSVPAAEALDAAVAHYLSDSHLASPETGCTIAALATETRRQTPEVRRVATRRARELVDLLERQMPGWGEPGRHEDALGVMSCLVGSMVIARLVDDPALAASVRAAAARLIRTATRDTPGDQGPNARRARTRLTNKI
jgi:TetR/AcrR family transcriptional regulator, transcriptional repressor for nem operon